MLTSAQAEIGVANGAILAALQIGAVVFFNVVQVDLKLVSDDKTD